MKSPSCISCKKPLVNLMEDYGENQPKDGLEFVSRGAYGTTVFDPMDGSAIAVNVCDDCITEHTSKGNVVYYDANRGFATKPKIWNGNSD